jgi:hypothetical protein
MKELKQDAYLFLFIKRFRAVFESLQVLGQLFSKLVNVRKREMKQFPIRRSRNTYLFNRRIPAFESDWLVDLHVSVFLLIFPEKAHIFSGCIKS